MKLCKYESYSERQLRLSKWRPHFAWWPVVVDGHYVWLEFLEKREVVLCESIIWGVPDLVTTEYRRVNKT